MVIALSSVLAMSSWKPSTCDVLEGNAEDQLFFALNYSPVVRSRREQVFSSISLNGHKTIVPGKPSARMSQTCRYSCVTSAANS